MHAHSTVAPPEQALWEAAEDFLRRYHQERGLDEAALRLRLREVAADIARRGHYAHRSEELVHGAKMAWRHSNRCIGRLFWKSLKVFDQRHLRQPDAIWAACQQHLDWASNGGQIRPLISVFAPQPPEGPAPVQFLNHQFIRYAAFPQADGSLLGDPASAALTAHFLAQGWQPQERGPFTPLPLAFRLADGSEHRYDWPREAILEVPLAHPEVPAFAAQGWRWYAVPVIADMVLEIGGIRYPAAPFNGWYMGTEIGARNLADRTRYDLLPQVARLLGLDSSRPDTLWQDRALVELNRAVLHAFRQQGVKIVDHHSAAAEFMTFMAKEAERGRQVSADWAWIVPPLSGSATPVFHQHYDDTCASPNFLYREEG